MNLIKKYIYSKQWLYEPNCKGFIYKNYNCVILRNSLLVLSGFVGVPTKYQIDIKNLYVHKGIDHVYYNMGFFKTHDINNNKLIWIGFSCSHEGDYIPILPTLKYPKGNSTYKNIEYVRQEIYKLVDQIKENGGD